ncbi:Uncharacterized protein Fot_32962 [Forsythia ovata]|uniref:Uncharacterized protein n=1 Tax=Forsythia ovata TaxID=205694 RepID=A0ABD1T9Q4_9LAMI
MPEDKPMESSPPHFQVIGATKNLTLEVLRTILIQTRRHPSTHAPEVRALTASKNHKEAERNCRERINFHLDRPKTLLLCNSKKDSDMLNQSSLRSIGLVLKRSVCLIVHSILLGGLLLLGGLAPNLIVELRNDQNPGG